MSAHISTGVAALSRTAALDMQQPTATQSSALVRRLIESSISSILYLRGIFAEECYNEESVGGFTVKHLKKSIDVCSSIPSDAKVQQAMKQAAIMSNWIENACGEPIAKRYLHSLTVGISVTPDKPWLIVECYTFHIRYGDDDDDGDGDGGDDSTLSIDIGDQIGIPLMSADGSLATTSMATSAKAGQPFPRTRGEVKASTKQLLQNLLSRLQSLPQLPSGRTLSMKLSYYPHTPAEYEPPQFCADIEAGTVYRLDVHGESVSVGQIESAHHSLATPAAVKPVQAPSLFGDLFTQLTQTTQTLPNTQILPMDELVGRIAAEDAVVNVNVNADANANINVNTNTNDNDNCTVNEDEQVCVCQSGTQAKIKTYVACSVCKKQFHWLCVGVTAARCNNLGNIQLNTGFRYSGKLKQFEQRGKCVDCAVSSIISETERVGLGATVAKWRNLVYAFWKSPYMNMAKMKQVHSVNTLDIRTMLLKMAKGGALQFESKAKYKEFVESADMALASSKTTGSASVFAKHVYQLSRKKAVTSTMLAILSSDQLAAIRAIAVYDDEMATLVNKMDGKDEDDKEDDDIIPKNQHRQPPRLSSPPAKRSASEMDGNVIELAAKRYIQRRLV
ncbi:DNA-binding protein [Ramicandelaber brevisporus]|nr:DNA-binding protein [Ramicandelaber brevisporus]